MSWKQKAHRERRDQAGRFTGNPCELCRKGAGEDYISHNQANAWGLGVCLCGRCAKKLAAMPDEEARQALEAAWKKANAR